MPRIKNLKITMMELVNTMAGGNPGAIRVCAMILKDGPAIDPDSADGGVLPLLLMDTFEIYDNYIWLLYKYICGEDLVKTIAVLRAIQMGGIADCTGDSIKQSLQFISQHIEVQLDTDEILEAVQDKLPNFGKKRTAD